MVINRKPNIECVRNFMESVKIQFVAREHTMDNICCIIVIMGIRKISCWIGVGGHGNRVNVGEINVSVPRTNHRRCYGGRVTHVTFDVHRVWK